MRAILIDRFVNVSLPRVLLMNDQLNAAQDYDEIKISEVVPKPQAKDGEVIVKVHAAGVNFVDLLYVSITNTEPLDSPGWVEVLIGTSLCRIWRDMVSPGFYDTLVLHAAIDELKSSISSQSSCKV